jgi:hypothetical protein
MNFRDLLFPRFKYGAKNLKKINGFNSMEQECNKWGGFCNELQIYFADEVGPIGFAQC